jgi:ABC-type multidrug transport system permease subunit
VTSLATSAGIGVAMWKRSLLEVVRVRGALFPTLLAPAIFMLGTVGQFGRLVDLGAFPTTSYLAWIVPLSCLQGAGFAGGAAGANLARDIEQGWFDRMLTVPVPRPVLLLGPILGAMTRALLPTTMILLLGIALGSGVPGGVAGVLLLYVAAGWFCVCASLWGSVLALRSRTQQIGPLIQNGVFIMVFLSTAYTPQVLLHGWLGALARFNPVTQILQLARQSTVEGIDPSWAHTWPGLLALTGMTVVLGGIALRELHRIGR